MVKNGLAVGNTTSTKAVINNAGQWIGDPTGVMQSSFDKANSANVLAQAAYDFANTITLSTGGSTFSILNSNTILNASQLNCLVDTSNGSFTITLPTTILYAGYVLFLDVRNIRQWSAQIYFLISLF